MIDVSIVNGVDKTNYNWQAPYPVETCWHLTDHIRMTSSPIYNLVIHAKKMIEKNGDVS